MAALAVVGVALILVILWDTFEMMVLPRRVTRKFRLTRFYYRSVWRLWSMVVTAVIKGRRQENLLSFFGPLSPWHLETKRRDNWIRSAWERGAQAAKTAGLEEEEEHF